MLPQATELIVAYSERDRTLTYQATGMPAFVRVARNRWTVTAVDDQHCRAAFDAVLTTSGILGRLPAGLLLIQVGRTRPPPPRRPEALRRARRALPTQASPARPGAGRAWVRPRPPRSGGAARAR
jgi:hypothetical protein